MKSLSVNSASVPMCLPPGTLDKPTKELTRSTEPIVWVPMPEFPGGSAWNKYVFLSTLISWSVS